MQPHTAKLAQPEGNRQVETETQVEHTIVTVVQCLLEQAEMGRRVSIANLRERIQTSKLLQCVKLLEEWGILSPSGANNQRTLAIAQAKELLAAYGAVPTQTDETLRGSQENPPNLTRLTKPLKQALLILIEQDRAGKQASVALFTKGLGIGHSKAVKIITTLSEYRVLGPLDSTTFQRSINIQCAIELLQQHDVSVPQALSSNNKQTSDEPVPAHVAS